MLKAGFLATVTLMAASITAWHWLERSPLPIGLAGGYGFAHRDGVLYAGGSTWQGGVKEIRADVGLYDAKTNLWTPQPALPIPLAYGASVVTSLGPEILGGIGAQEVNRYSYRLNPHDNKWHVSGMLPAASLLSRAEAIGDEIYLFGGCDDLADLTRCSDGVFKRDSSGNWTRIASLPQGAVALWASAVAGKSIYLFGGCSSAGNHADVWRFTVATHTWQRVRSLPQPVRGMAAIAVDGRHILLAGGYAESFSANMLIFDTETDLYLPAGELPLPAANLALVRTGPMLRCIGGEDRMKSRSPRVFAATIPR